MIYLAQIERKVFKRSIEIKLIAYSRSNYWMALDDIRIVNVPLSSTNLGDNVIVVIDLYEPSDPLFWSKGRSRFLGEQGLRIIKLIPANSEIGNNEVEEIKLWKESLQFQSRQFEERREHLDSREEQIKKSEDELKAKLKAVALQVEKIKKEQESLKNSWAALGYEREQMEK